MEGEGNIPASRQFWDDTHCDASWKIWGLTLCDLAIFIFLMQMDFP